MPQGIHLGACVQDLLRGYDPVPLGPPGLVPCQHAGLWAPGRETLRVQALFTWNLRGGPSGWIRALATSATIMPRWRTAGRLLSRRLFTPAMRLASSSRSSDTHRLSAADVLGRAGMGPGAHVLLTIPAVPELCLPQVHQADEDSLADVALLRQRCVADGTAAAPRLQELLQRLVGGMARPG